MQAVHTLRPKRFLRDDESLYRGVECVGENLQLLKHVREDLFPAEGFNEECRVFAYGSTYMKSLRVRRILLKGALLHREATPG